MHLATPASHVLITTCCLQIVYGAKKGQYLPMLPPGTRSSCRILRLDDVISLGQDHPRAHIPPSPKDLALLCFTSGTTGVPKGAMLTHGNLIANAGGDIDRCDWKAMSPGEHPPSSCCPLVIVIVTATCMMIIKNDFDNLKQAHDLSICR